MTITFDDFHGAFIFAPVELTSGSDFLAVDQVADKALIDTVQKALVDLYNGSPTARGKRGRYPLLPPFDLLGRFSTVFLSSG
jgi:hypothetical protein